MPSLPKITVQPSGQILAGPYVLEPSSRNWRRRRCWWRARLDGKIASGWCFTPSLALAAAVRKNTAAQP